MTSTADLVELVRKYQVCWEVWPENALVDGRSQQVGFELELLGTDNQMATFAPTCARSMAIRSALEELAKWILEQDEEVNFELSSADSSFCYSAARGNRPDVSLSIKILHRHGFEKPIDESERSCLEKAKVRLRQLGAGEHRWYRSRSDSSPLSAAS